MHDGRRHGASVAFEMQLEILRGEAYMCDLAQIHHLEGGGPFLDQPERLLEGGWGGGRGGGEVEHVILQVNVGYRLSCCFVAPLSRPMGCVIQRKQTDVPLLCASHTHPPTSHFFKGGISYDAWNWVRG